MGKQVPLENARFDATLCHARSPCLYTEKRASPESDMIDVRHNQQENRFEAIVEGRLCWLDYRRVGNVLTLVYTAVPGELQNRGIAGELVEGALAYAAAHALKAVPQCSYIRAYMCRRAATGTAEMRRRGDV